MKYKDTENGYIQGGIKVGEKWDVWLEHRESDFRVLEFESHEVSKL